MKINLSQFDKIKESKIEILSENNKPFALYLPDTKIFLDLLNFRILKGSSDLPNSGIIAFASEKNTLGETFLIPRLFFYDQTISIYLGF